MKSLKLAVLAITFFSLFTGGNALASGQASITATATVLGTCSFDVPGTYNLAFGVIDQGTLGAADVTATTALAFTCSNGTVWTLTDETLSAAGTKGMTGGDTGTTLNYQIDDDYTFTGTGNGGTQNVTVAGRILNASALAALADVYSGTFTIDITP